MSYPNKAMYEILFAKWLDHETDLLEYANIKEGDVVGDFCCGGMRLTKRIHALTKTDVYAVDESHDMGPTMEEWRGQEYKGIQFYISDIESFCYSMGPDVLFFDTIFCQQAINYWFKDILGKESMVKEDFLNGIKPGGQFIFNTFNTCPDKGTTKKEYDYKDRHYIEFNTFYENKIYHIQMCDDLPPMLTVFDWIPPEEFLETLSPYFNVEVFRKGKTDIYRCTRNTEIAKSWYEDSEDEDLCII